VQDNENEKTHYNQSMPTETDMGGLRPRNSLEQLIKEVQIWNQFTSSNIEHARDEEGSQTRGNREVEG
jgi:hypothetical protein